LPKNVHYCFPVTEEEEDDDEEEIIIVEPELTAIYIPNAFTPNGDGINDLFKPEGENFSLLSMQIFDRYGNLIHDQAGPDAAWDGRRRGEMLQSGIYIYTIQILNHLGEQELHSGDLNLMR